jgi:hypothetical protein
LAKLTLTDIANITTAAAAINANNALIEAAVENTLSRDTPNPGGPNHMLEPLDMNSFKIINLAPPTNPNDAARLTDITNGVNTSLLPDDDYGDIVVTDSGATMSLDAAVATAAGRAIMGAADATAQRAALGLGTAAVSATGDFAAAAAVPDHVALGYEAAHPGIEAFANTAALWQANTAVSSHAGALDPHPGYTTAAELATAVSNHVAATDPHADYPTFAEVATSLSDHAAAADPHSVYQLESGRGAANGYASLDGTVHVPVGELGTGTPDNTKYLRGDGVWAVGTGGGVLAIDDLTDVTITSPATGATLVYNGSAWVDGKLDLTDADAANFDGAATAFYETGTVALTGGGAGWAIVPTTTLRYTRVGRVVTLAYESGDVRGTLTSSTAGQAVFGDTGGANTLPASIRPGVGRRVSAIVCVGDAGAEIFGNASLYVLSDGRLIVKGLVSDYATTGITCATEFTTNGFVAAAVGLGSMFCITYSM